jgi:hypothetical protein
MSSLTATGIYLESQETKGAFTLATHTFTTLNIKAYIESKRKVI